MEQDEELAIFKPGLRGQNIHDEQSDDDNVRFCIVQGTCSMAGQSGWVYLLLAAGAGLGNKIRSVLFHAETQGQCCHHKKKKRKEKVSTESTISSVVVIIIKGRTTSLPYKIEVQMTNEADDASVDQELIYESSILSSCWKRCFVTNQVSRLLLSKSSFYGNWSLDCVATTNYPRGDGCTWSASSQAGYMILSTSYKRCTDDQYIGCDSQLIPY